MCCRWLKTKLLNQIMSKGDCSISESFNIIFDKIRMLVAEGYQSAFVRVGPYKLDFLSVTRKVEEVYANIKIVKEGSDD